MFDFKALTKLLDGHKGSKAATPAELSEEWDEIQAELEKFEECPESELPASTVKNITRLHWKKSSECNTCSNEACKRGLWAASKHHCRRCGNIFCAKCTQFQRRLSPNASYDPNGWFFKVCEKCYYYEPQTVGFTESQTGYFEGWRAAKHLESKVLTRPVILRNMKNLVQGFEIHYKPPPPPVPTPPTQPPPKPSPAPTDPGAATPPEVRKQRNLFASSLFKGIVAMRQGVGGLHNAPRWMKQSAADLQKAPGWVAKGVSEVPGKVAKGVYEMPGKVARGVYEVPGRVKQGVTNLQKAETWVKRVVPEWQKPPTWVSEGTSCQCCDRPYPALEQCHNCRVCGKLVCKAQSTLDLLLYKPDLVDQALAGSHPRWALIRVVGSPEIEPDHHLNLRVCTTCRDHLQIIQVEEYQRLTQGQGLVSLCWQQMVATYQDIASIRSKIDHQLPEFTKIVAKVEVKTKSPEVKVEPDKDNKEQITKYESEISHHLSLFVAVLSRLKELRPQTQGQVKLLKNIIKCQQGYYVEMNRQFKQLLTRLKQITPKSVHQEIMELLETEALNSACASLNQLEEECRYLCETHNLNIDVPLIIKETAEMVEIEMKEKMEETGEDWSEQKEELDDFVHIQLQGIPEANILPHRMIHPSRHLLLRLGTSYLEWLVSRKAFEVLNRIRLQLMIRNAAKESLQATSESLNRLKETTQGETLKED